MTVMATTATASEPFGTTPFPTSQSGSPVRVVFDDSLLADYAQQPQTQQIAVFDASPSEVINGSALAVNPHFCVYAVKKGLIRVLHRHSTLRSLLRGHSGQTVTDIQFFQDGDVLATVGSNAEKSSLFVWRIFQRATEIVSEKLLEITTTCFRILRVMWHPFNPNQFWMIHTDSTKNVIATLAETTRITTVAHSTEGHAVCAFYNDYLLMDGAVQISVPASALTDLTWSGRDTRHILTTHASGEVRFWDWKDVVATASGASAKCLFVIKESDSPVTRCMFLPHEHAINGDPESALTTCFVTASDNNRELTLWSAFEQDKQAAKVQVLALKNPSESYIVDVCFGPAPADASPPSAFIVMADCREGKLFAFHCKAAWKETSSGKKAVLEGSDYVVPFTTKFPIYSWSVVCAPTTDISEEELNEQGGLIFDMKLFSYQSTVVQCLTLTSYMCLPPEYSWTDPTPGVLVERLLSVHSAHVSDIASDDDVEYDEEYDIEEDFASENSYEDDESPQAPDPSSLPVPDDSLDNNPFANWLGAIAAKSSSAAGTAEAVPAPPTNSSKEVATIPSEPATYLSPLDILSGKAPQPPQKQQQPSSKSKKERKKSPMVAAPVPSTAPATSGKISILKRDDVSSTPVIAAPKSAVPKGAALVESTGYSAAPAQVVSNEAFMQEIRKAVREEVQSTVSGAVQKAVQETLRPALDRLAKQGVQVDTDKIASALNIEDPIRGAFVDGLRTLVIPAMESVTGQILLQVSERAVGSTTLDDEKDSQLEAISTQLSTMTALVAKLTDEIQTLRAGLMEHPKTVPQQNQAAAAVVERKAEDTIEKTKKEVLGLLAEKKYELAFTKAVSASTAEMAVFCCENADLNDVLGGATVHLTQPILLCLMQQLGTVLPRTASLTIELEWLQEIALSLNPADESIKRHVPGVLQQLVASINQRMGLGDPALRRPLQRLLQVVRGMQMG